MDKLIKICSLTIVLICMAMAINSCSKDDNSTPDYVGLWYRFNLNNDATELQIVVWDIRESIVHSVLYKVKGKNIDRSNATISNVSKTVETFPFNVSGNIITSTDGREMMQLKYSIIENQLIMTDMSNGNLYSLLRMTSEVQQIVNDLEKIAI